MPAEDPKTEARLIAILAVLVLCNVTLPALHYAGYLSVPICLLYAWRHGRVRETYPWVRPFLVLTVLGVLLSPFGSTMGLADAFFIFSGICVGVVCTRFRVSLGHLAVLLLIAWPLSVKAGGWAEKLDVWNSSSPLESPLSFVFGLLALACAIEK